jgi:hypothetical protein
MGSAAGVGEGSVFAGAVVADRVGLEDLAAGGDLDHVADEGELDLAAAVGSTDAIGGAGEAHRVTLSLGVVPSSF